MWVDKGYGMEGKHFDSIIYDIMEVNRVLLILKEDLLQKMKDQRWLTTYFIDGESFNDSSEGPVGLKLFPRISKLLSE